MITFKSPLPGTMFLLTDEQICHGNDKVDCILEAPAGHSLSVNGVFCDYKDGYYFVSLPLKQQMNSLIRYAAIAFGKIPRQIW